MPAITGVTLLTGSEIRNSDASQLHPLGTAAETLGGRKYRYMQVGGTTALVKGNLLQGPAQTANHTNQVVGDAGSVGDLFINVDLGDAALTANQYADGFITINDAAGEGITYRVSGHAAADASATSVRINISEPVDQALTADTSEYTLESLWRDVIQNPTSPTNIPVGVADVAYAVDIYFWGQTWGVGSVLQEATGGAGTVGNQIEASDTTAGAVEVASQVSDADQAHVGVMMTAGADAEHQAVFLLIS